MISRLLVIAAVTIFAVPTAAAAKAGRTPSVETLKALEKIAARYQREFAVADRKQRELPAVARLLPTAAAATVAIVAAAHPAQRIPSLSKPEPPKQSAAYYYRRMLAASNCKRKKPAARRPAYFYARPHARVYQYADRRHGHSYSPHGRKLEWAFGHRRKWHGWVQSRSGRFKFFLNGHAYRGGTPYGPAFAYNNWEGGFNPKAFWELQDRMGF
jgi:hypothetical protein